MCATCSDGFVCESQQCARLRPAEAPDFLIVAVSGHCNPARCGTSYNDEYLHFEGTVDAIAEPMTSAGFSVGYIAFTDNFYDEPVGGTPSALGYLSLLGTLANVRDQWISDFANPTRLIVVGHSHGAVWSHLALHTLDGWGTPVPVDFLIDLDAVSDGWQEKAFLGFGDDWGNVLYGYTVREGVSWPFDPWNVVDAFSVPGVGNAEDIEDIVPASALINIEVWSSDGTSIRDRDQNHRRDGSLTDLYFFMSEENHENTVLPRSDAVQAVQQALRDGYAL